jgi:hypothetical protein
MAEASAARTVMKEEGMVELFARRKKGHAPNPPTDGWLPLYPLRPTTAAVKTNSHPKETKRKKDRKKETNKQEKGNQTGSTRPEDAAPPRPGLPLSDPPARAVTATARDRPRDPRRRRRSQVGGGWRILTAAAAAAPAPATPLPRELEGRGPGAGATAPARPSRPFRPAAAAVAAAEASHPPSTMRGNTMKLFRSTCTSP